jgi:hypothetical protein
VTPELPHLIVCGGRDFADRELLVAKLDQFTRDLGPKIVVVTGACPTGADKLAEDWASKKFHTVLRFHAEWSRGAKAGPERNQEMVDHVKPLRNRFAVAFWDGKSRGTKDCVARIQAAGIALKIVRY